MKIKKKHKNWLIIGLAIIGILILAKSAFTVENILGIPFFSQTFAVIGPTERAYEGDTFEHTFTLTNRNTQTLPRDLYDSDGDGVDDTQVLLFKGFRMNRYNTIGTQEIVDTGCDIPENPDCTGYTCSCDFAIEISTPIDSSSTIAQDVDFEIVATTPSSPAGKPYGVSTMLFKVTQTWDRNTNTWTETPEIIDSIDTDSSLGVQFDVTTQTPPPSPSPEGLMAWFGQLFAAIWEALKTLLGW